MPFNGNGAFQPPGADFPAVAATLIEATKFNNVINDIATGLSTCITKDGQTTVTNNIPLNGYKLTGVGAPVSTGDALSEGRAIGAVTPAAVKGTTLAATLNSAVGVTETAAAGGTTTLTASSTGIQRFTGTVASQIVTLPDVTTIPIGTKFVIVADTTTGIITVKTSGANTKAFGAGGMVMILESILTTGTGTASWQVTYSALTVTGTGSLVMASQPTIANLNYTGALAGTGVVQSTNATAIPAGGGTAVFAMSSTANFGVFMGSGAPTVSAAKGSLYLRSDGSTTNNRMYVNTDGGTTWTAVTTVA